MGKCSEKDVLNAKLSRGTSLRRVRCYVCSSDQHRHPNQFWWTDLCFLTVGSEQCFKLFDNRVINGLGENAQLSEAMDKICGTTVFRNLLPVGFDMSGTFSEEVREGKVFVEHRDNLQVIWECCVLSKIGMDESRCIFDVFLMMKTKCAWKILQC